MESMVIYGFFTVFSLGLCVISLMSYARSKNKKLLFVTGVFILFAIKGIVLSLSLFSIVSLDVSSIPLLSIFDVVVILLLFMATLKR